VLGNHNTPVMLTLLDRLAKFPRGAVLKEVV
jgi:hypothetical protein